MAGRFLTSEEAARQLGVSVEELNRLVDRKQLFPMRDGTTLKFKVDDIERFASQAGDDPSIGSDLSLEIEPPAKASASGIGAVEFDLDEAIDAGESIFSADAPDPRSASQTVVRGDAAVEGVSGVSGLALPSGIGGAGVSAADIVLGGSAVGDAIEGDELALESIIGASSPSLPPSGEPRKSPVEGTVAVDLSDVGMAVGDEPRGPASASRAAASAISKASGSGLSGILDSGLSLEGAEVQVSGIDLGGGAAVDGGTVLATGDEFELGGLDADEESASVVIATDSESGDSSFFGQTMAGEGSSISDEGLSTGSSSVSSESLDYPIEQAVDMKFSIWQVIGLVCCSLLLLFGGFVAYDL
ncbi:MAG: DNA-binding protein, partial [Planctomycetia bacterium]|nr:DNA-binding protein [Planctomycetia bacterium]